MASPTSGNPNDVALRIVDGVVNVNVNNDHGSRHNSVVVHRRGFGALARGVDEVRVISEAAHGIQVPDIEKQVAGVVSDQYKTFLRASSTLSPLEGEMTTNFIYT